MQMHYSVQLLLKIKMLKVIFAAVVCLLCASIARGRLDESALTDELRDLIASLHKQCTQETGVDNDVIERTHDGDFSTDSKLKCYMKCIMAEGGAMDESGNVDFTAIEEILPDKLKAGIKNMFDQCVPQATNADFCEKAFEFFTCCYKVDPKDYFLI